MPIHRTTLTTHLKPECTHPRALPKMRAPIPQPERSRNMSSSSWESARAASALSQTSTGSGEGAWEQAEQDAAGAGERQIRSEASRRRPPRAPERSVLGRPMPRARRSRHPQANPGGDAGEGRASCPSRCSCLADPWRSETLPNIPQHKASQDLATTVYARPALFHRNLWHRS